jgi:ABC-type microcin C transport system permease subunit YejE
MLDSSNLAIGNKRLNDFLANKRNYWNLPIVITLQALISLECLIIILIPASIHTHTHTLENNKNA